MYTHGGKSQEKELWGLLARQAAKNLIIATDMLG
jgi:hypothetical protein